MALEAVEIECFERQLREAAHQLGFLGRVDQVGPDAQAGRLGRTGRAGWSGTP
jgi:hypothetical protein